MLLLGEDDGGVVAHEGVEEVEVDGFGGAVFGIVEVVDLTIGIRKVHVDTIVLPRKLVLITQVEFELTVLDDGDHNDAVFTDFSFVNSNTVKTLEISAAKHCSCYCSLVAQTNETQHLNR